MKQNETVINIHIIEGDRTIVEFTACDGRATGAYRIMGERADKFLEMFCGYLIEENKIDRA